MILDNENKNPKVHEWITEYTTTGKMSIVSGYFTVGALAWLSQQINDKISEFRFIIGDMVDWSSKQEDALDLLNEELSIEGALKMCELANEAVEFLKQDKILMKTLEPNFCHAKLFFFMDDKDRANKNFYITGSSNLTEAGIGLKYSSNIELNHADFGAGNYLQYVEWFENLWKSKNAHSKKTIIHENGKTDKVDFKTYLIDKISLIFNTYTPKQIYYKILFELYGSELHLDESDAEFNRKIGRLTNTVIFNRLYEFQKKGVFSLIKMMDKFGGAILADAVGLGKTWTTLAVIKHYEYEGYQSIILCPKKIEQNWNKFIEKDNLFYRDNFDYVLRFHTDLSDDQWESHRYQGKQKFDKSTFCNNKPILLVIDESHNLRNNKSQRYLWLVEELLKKTKGQLKVLLLSATPINNSLWDLRNQFRLLVKDNDYGFRDSEIEIGSIDYIFRNSRKAMREWQEEGATNIGGLINKLPPGFIRLTDNLLVARNRDWVANIEKTLFFPKKEKPLNIFVTPKNFGTFESFEELFDSFPDRMSAYLPSYYIDIKKPVKKTEDERQREHFLVKMMQILMTKRLESSWSSLQSTVIKILNHHENALSRVQDYEKNKNEDVSFEIDDVFDHDEYSEIEKFTLGKKGKVSIREIDKAGKLNFFKSDLKDDINKLQQIKLNLEKFSAKIEKETNKPNNTESADTKLERLMTIIKQKQGNGSNRKILIFSVYADTVKYLYTQLKKRGFTNLAMVTGEGSQTWESEVESKHFEHILERFAPYTKMYHEKNWEGFRTDKKNNEAFEDWLEWLCRENKSEFDKIHNSIDILIATDALSEGQNFQDCDMVINYDIHWNPVRVIQRMGRIDRLGSPNDKIFGVNFWPTASIEKYLDLKGRIERRMATMRLAGAEVNLEFSDEFREIAEDEKLEKHQEKQMLLLMENTLDEKELGTKTLGMDDFSMENFRQELEQALSLEKQYRDMPRGIFSGVAKDDRYLKEPGIIALLGTPKRPANSRKYKYTRFELIYIRDDGSPVYSNIKDTLAAMSLRLPDAETHTIDALKKGESNEIQKWKNAIEKWILSQRSDAYNETAEAKSESTKLIDNIASGDLKAISDVKNENIPDAIYKIENFDLVCWLTIK